MTSEIKLFRGNLRVDVAPLTIHERQLGVIAERNDDIEPGSELALPGRWLRASELLGQLANTIAMDFAGTKDAFTGVAGLPQMTPNKPFSYFGHYAVMSPVVLQNSLRTFVPLEDIEKDSKRGLPLLLPYQRNIINQSITELHNRFKYPETEQTRWHIMARFVGEKFTIAHLGRVSQLLSPEKSFNPSNFARTMNESDCFEPTGEKVPPVGGRGRPAELYRLK